MGTVGIILAAEGGTKNEEGFIRFVVRLLVLLDSEVSNSDINGVDEGRRGEGTCKVGMVEGGIVAGCEGAGIAAGDWNGCPGTGAFEAFPMVTAALKKFARAESSGASLMLVAADEGGSKGPSMTAIVGTASSSSNSLFVDVTLDF